jgi:hypothetical protein
MSEEIERASNAVGGAGFLFFTSFFKIKNIKLP